MTPATGLGARLAAFARDTRGAAALYFTLMLPVVFGLFLLGFDGGVTTTRASLLERAVDMTARSVRNGTLAPATLAAIRTDLCARLTAFPDCARQVKVQLVTVPRADFAMPAAGRACADEGSALVPVRRFVQGQSNPLALLVACMDVTAQTPAGLMPGRPATYAIRASALIAARAQ